MVKIPHDPTWQPKMHEYPAGTGFKHHLYQPCSHQNEHGEPGGRDSDELNTHDRTPMDILKTHRNVSKSVQPQVTKLTEEIIENPFMKIGTDLNYSFSSLKDASDGSRTFVREIHSKEAAPQVKSPSEMPEKDPISNLEESCEHLVSDTSITNSPCSASSYRQKISQTIVKAAFGREKYTGEESSAGLNLVQDVLLQLIERLITDLGTLPLSLPYFIKGIIHDMPYSSVTQLNIMSCINILMMESKSEVRLVANVIIEIVLEKVYSHILLKVQQEEAAPMELQIPHTAKFYLKSPDLVDGQNENSYFITNNKPYLRTGSSEVLMQKENGQASSSAVTKELVQQVGDKFESFVTSRLQQISVSEPDFKYGAISELTSFGKRNSKIKETVLPKIQISNPLLIFPSFTSTKDPKILLSRIYVSKSVLEVYAKYVLHDIFQLIQTELKLETYRRTALRGDMVPLANITTATNTVQSLLSDLHYECKKTYFSPIGQFTLPRHQSCGATCTPLIHKPKRTTETPLTVLNFDDVNLFSKRDNENARLPSQIRNSSWKPQNATNLKADRKLKSTQKTIEKRHISKETAIHEETINYLPDISNTSLVPKSVFKTLAERKIKDPLLHYFEQKAERPDSETSTEMAASSERFIAFKMKGKIQTYKADIEVNSLEGKNGKEEAMMLKSSKLDTFLKPEVSSCALDRICVKTPPDTPDNVSQLKPDSDTSLKARAPIKNAVTNSHHNSRQQNTTAHNQFDHMNNLLSKYGILAVSDKSQSVQITDEYQQRQHELGTLANTTFLPQNKCMCTPTTKHAFNNKLNSQREMSPTLKKYSDPLAVKSSVQNSTHKNQCSTGKKDETLKTNAIHQYPCFKYIPITYSHADPIYGNIANLNSVSSLHTACGLESKVSEVMIPQVSNVVSHSFPPGELKCSIIKPKESEKAVSQSSTDKSTADVKNVAVPQNTIHKSSYIDQQKSPSSLHLLNAVPKKVVPGVFEKCLPASSFHTKASICDEGLQMSLKESKSYDIGQSEGNEFFEGMRMCENEKYIQIMVEQIHSPKMKYSLSYDVDFRNKSVKPNSFSPVSNESTLNSSNNLSKYVNGPELLNTEQSGMIQQPSIRDPSHVENPTESISEKQYPQTASSILPFAELKQVLSTSAETGRYMHPVDCVTTKTICVPIPKPTELTSSSFQQEQWKQKIGRKLSTSLSAHTIRQKDHKSYDNRQTPDGNEFFEGNNMCENEKYIQILVEQLHSPKMKYSLSYDVDFRNKSVKPNSFSPVSNESTLDSSNNLSTSVNGPVLLNTEQPGMIQQPSIRDPSHVEKPTESRSEKQYSQTASSILPFAELKQVLSTSAETGRHMLPVDCVTSKTICVPIPKPTELTSSSFQQEQWKQKIGRKLSTNLSAHTIGQKDHKSYDNQQTPDGNEFYEGNNMWEKEKYIHIMVEQIHSPKMKYSLSYDVDFRNTSVKPNSFSPVSNESTLDSSNSLPKSVNGLVFPNTEEAGMIQQPSIRDPSHVENPTDSISEKQYSQTASSNLPFAELKQVLSASAETGRHMLPVDCVTSKTICVPIPKTTELTSSSFQQEQWKQEIGRKVSTHLSAHKIRQKDHKSHDKRQTPDGNEFYEGNNMCENEKYIQIMVEQLHSPKMKYSLSYDVTSSKKSLAGNSFSPVANELEVDSSHSMSTPVKDVVFLNTEETRITKQSSIGDPSYVKNPSQSISEEFPHITSANMPMKTVTLKQVLPTSAETRRHMPSVDFVTLENKCVPKTIYASSSNIQQGQRKDGISTILPRDLTELESSRKKSDNVVEQMINGKSVSSWFSKAELMKATYDQHEACPTNLFTTVQSDNIYHKDQCDMSFLNERHSFTGVYPDSFLEDILSGLLSKIIFVSSINAMRERVGEPYEGELCEVALKCLNSMLAYLTTLQIKIVKADEIIQCFPPIENFDIDEAVHSIYCNVLQEYGSQRAVYTTLINDSDMFAERIIKLVLKQIYNCALKSSVSEKFISYPCTMLEARNIIQKVIHNVHKPGYPWQALSLHSTLLFATTCLEDIITNLISDIFSPSANSATHPGNQTVLSETEFNAISAQLRHKVLQNISKNKACNTNNSNMKHYLQTELDIQKVAESVHSAVLHVYKSPKAIQTALVSTNGTILEIIAKTIILEVTHYLQPFYSGEITHTPCTSSAENTVMMLPKTKHCPPSGQSNKLSFGVYTASFLEDVISGLISKIFFTSNGHAEDKNISECDLSEIVLNCVNCLIRDLTKYPIEVITITEETLDDVPNKNDVGRVVDSLFHNVLKELGSHQAIEHDLSNNIFFAQRINCLLLSEIVDYQVQPSQSLELSHHQYTTLEANNIVHKIENYVKKTRDQDTPCSSLTTKLSSEFIEDIVIRLISKIFTADGNKYKGNQSLVSDSEFKDMISTFLCDVMSEISNCDIKDTWSETYVRYSQKDILNVVDLLYNKMLTKYGTQLAAQDKIRTGSKTVVKGIARYLIKVISSPKFVAVSNGESSSSSNVSSSMSSGVEHDQCCLDVSQDASKVTAHTTVYSSSLVEEVISGSLSNTTEFVSKNSFMKELKPEIGKVALKDLKTKQELLVGSAPHDIEHPDTDLVADHSIEGDLKGASCLMDSNNELQLEKQHPSDGQSVKNKRSSIARMKRFIKVHFNFKGRHSTKTLDSQKDLDHPDTNQAQGGSVSYFMKHNSGPKYDSSRQNDILDPDNLKYSNQSKESIPSGLKSNATRPNSEGQTLLNINSGSFSQDSAMNTEMPHTHPPPRSSSIQSRPSSRSVRKRWHQLLWSRVKCCQCTRPEVETETEEHQYNSTTEETNSTQQIPQDLAESSASVSPAEKLPLSTRASLAKLVFQKKISRIPTKDEKNESVPSKTKM